MLETVGQSLRLSCRPGISWQGISLLYDCYSYNRRLLGLQFNSSKSPLKLLAPGRRQTLYFMLPFCRVLIF